MSKYVLFISSAFILVCLFLVICCDLYFPPDSFKSPLPTPTAVPTPWPAPTMFPTPTVPPNGNLIYNHDFSNGLDRWTFWVYEAAGAEATASVVAEQAVITIINGGTDAWHVQFLHKYLIIEQGKTYTLTFDAYATPAARNINVSIGEDGFDNNGDDSDYTAYRWEPFSLTTAMPGAPYTFTFTMSEPTDTEARLCFDLGNDDNDVIFDNVMLTEEP